MIDEGDDVAGVIDEDVTGVIDEDVACVIDDDVAGVIDEDVTGVIDDDDSDDDDDDDGDDGDGYGNPCCKPSTAADSDDGALDKSLRPILILELGAAILLL
jgi:hypothetical protein